ncbi:MFS transporter [Amycolatopsis sp. GM8]|uniref:MFS transporter n=1 Tax=Amycolatopsis sp. GM8 TaxID=2896530 RepID=UPI001F1F7878|nr:MFS transporter [Amycolatopsis sp. GM8]
MDPVTNTPEQHHLAAVALTARMERLPRLTRTHFGWMALLGVLFLCDVADINSLSYALPAIRSEWTLSLGQVGALTSYTFLGMLAGAIAGGRLSDRIGRRPTLVAATLFYSLASVACAVAPNFAVLAVLRVLTGFGLQAVTGVVIVYAAEMFPGRLRGRLQSILLGIGLLGLPVMAGAARAIVPLGPGAWRWVFVIGGFGIIPGLIALFVLPETVRWQEVRGRAGKTAELLVGKLERECAASTGAPLPDPVERTPEPPRPLAELRRSPYLGRVVVISLTLAFGNLGYYGFSAWVPTLLVQRGYSTAQALTVTTILAISPFIGALAALPIADRWERKRTSPVLCVLIAAAMIVFAITTSPVVLVVAGFLVTLLLQTNVAVQYAYLAEIFPTSLRGLGAGIANGAGRLAVVLGSLLIAAVSAGFGFTGVFVTTATALLLGGVTLAAYGVSTRNRTLGDIAGR